ncbi:MAG TPA: hypothetical protein VLK82_19545 [Candidatus Tectomicrobia bacterium]|nr:hypothetical protein [Candidatus Tectomicrobia bacterium]
MIDSTDYAGGPIEAWLHTKGFRLEHGAEDPALLALSHKAGALVFEAKQPVRGFVVDDQVKLEHVSTIRITWGIITYPKDASYERKVNYEALMVYISFGQDDVSPSFCADLDTITPADCIIHAAPMSTRLGRRRSATRGQGGESSHPRERVPSTSASSWKCSRPTRASRASLLMAPGQ